MDNIICNETNFNEKNVTCKTQSFYILLTLFPITIALLIAVSIYCHLIKYQAKQKDLLLFHDTKSKTNQYLQYKLKMSNKAIILNIKNRTYYFFNDIIDKENFNLVK